MYLQATGEGRNAQCHRGRQSQAIPGGHVLVVYEPGGGWPGRHIEGTRAKAPLRSVISQVCHRDLSASPCRQIACTSVHEC